TGSCVPGATVTIGCGSHCGGGACAGDAVMRICEGTTACGNRTALGLGDDGCSTTGAEYSCPVTDFTCPPSGTYTVLVGGFYPGDAITCDARVVRETLDGGVVMPDAGVSDGGGPG